MKITAPGNQLDALVRQTRAHHVQLSSMADLKANMLLTMASIVITLAAPQAMKAGYQWALLILIGFCLITIVLAAYVVMPKIPFRAGEGHPVPDVKSPQFNLLFFGDFTGLSYAQFEAEIEAVLNDTDRTYEVQVREIYVLGTFLADKKYRFLRLAYTMFITGLFASFITMLITGARA